MMKKKYSRSKKPVYFQPGENVVLWIKKRDRSGTNVSNLPCCVVHRSSGPIPTYRLMSSAGVLTRRYASSLLSHFPGTVRLGDPEVEVGLREAVRQFGDPLPKRNCGCRGECRDRKCVCLNLGRTCTANCHGKEVNKKCMNKSTFIKNANFPCYGGSFNEGETKVNFSNTCPLDTWFTILKSAYLPKHFDGINSVYDTTKQLLEENKFNEAKVLFANHFQRQPVDGVIMFEGSEFDSAIKPLIGFNFSHSLSSSCSNPECPIPNLRETYQTVPVYNHHQKLTRQSIIQQIQAWFLQSEKDLHTQCARKFPDTFDRTTSQNFFLDENKESKYVI